MHSLQSVYLVHSTTCVVMLGGVLSVVPEAKVSWWVWLSSAGRTAQVFFIRDGIQFVDLVHCLRPNPKTNIQEGWRILDFLSHHPESVHIVRRPRHGPPALPWPALPMIGLPIAGMRHRPEHAPAELVPRCFFLARLHGTM